MPEILQYFAASPMHFRVRKNVVQLVRNVYDPVAKRAVASVVGRMQLADPVLTDEIRQLLTPEELTQTKDWIEAQHRLDNLRSELAALQLTEQMALAAQWFERGVESDLARSSAEQIVQAWQKLRLVLRKKGLVE